MEEVCNRENLVRAWKRVRQNRGSPGVDGMTIGDAKDYLREHWASIRSQLLAGTYQPQPVKRVEIPKPDGGIRKLGVPCVAKARLTSGGSAVRPSPAIAIIRSASMMATPMGCGPSGDGTS